MTDLSERLVAAIQQVRTSTPHKDWCVSLAPLYHLQHDGSAIQWQRNACTCDWLKRVDARLAVCVEAAIKATINAAGSWTEQPASAAVEAGLAAFLAAAAQKETTK